MTETHWERVRMLQEKVTRNYNKKREQEIITRKGNKKLLQEKVTRNYFKKG